MSYGFYVDWYNDGTFDDANEDVSARVLARTPVTIQRGKDQIRALAPPMAGSANLELDNVSKDYSYENGASSIAGLVLPNRQMRIQAVSGSTYNLFTGFLEDIVHHSERDKMSVELPALGTLSWLRGQKVSTQLYQNIRTDQAISYLLDAVSWPNYSQAGDAKWDEGLWGTFTWGSDGWPVALRSLDTGRTTLDWWWLANEDAFDALVELLNTEGPGASVYEDGGGKLHFESRWYRNTTARCTSSQATFQDIGTEPFFSAFRYEPRAKDIINSCTMDVITRQTESLQKVWGADADVSLRPDEVKNISVRTTNPFTGAVTPESGTDYTVSSGGLITISLNRTSGATVIMTITAGSSGVTLSNLQLRAQPVTVLTTTKISNTQDTSASIQKYGTREYTPRIRQEISQSTAQDLTNAIVILYKDPRPIAVFNVMGKSGTNLTQCLSREISDRVTVVDEQTELNSAMYIEQIKHTIHYGGQLHETEFGCEKVSSLRFMIWGTTTWGSHANEGVWGF